MEHDSDQISHAYSDSFIPDEQIFEYNENSSNPKKIKIDPILEV